MLKWSTYHNNTQASHPHLLQKPPRKSHGAMFHKHHTGSWTWIKINNYFGINIIININIIIIIIIIITIIYSSFVLKKRSQEKVWLYFNH